jgi:transcriptional regulator with XRE-family HTH domain
VSISNNIRKARTAAGLSQEQAAIAVGVGVQTIYSWEAGIRQPNYVNALRLERVYGVSHTEFLRSLTPVAQ